MQQVVYNSLTRKKENFVPLNAPQVLIYVCGPTVYDYLHIGNFRGYVFFNLVRNWLEEQGYQVRIAINFTDVDDKIIDRAKIKGWTPDKLAAHFVEECKADFKTLGLKPHDLNPKVTETMPEIKQFIKELISLNMAYVQEGDVWYSVQNFSDYGKLSNRKTDELLSGTRVQIQDKKRSPLDFALWKSAKQGEPSWDSEWGPGRPGWHIECSAMIQKHLGKQIDIHGGGLDLMFPHHENEIAQSEGLNKNNFVKYWMHWNMLNLTGSKMSKSLGNILSLREFFLQHDSEIYKWMILNVHYRSILEFGEESIHRAIAGLAKVYSALNLARSFLTDFNFLNDSTPRLSGTSLDEEGNYFWTQISKSLSDDFNTPEAFAAMYEWMRVFQSQVSYGQKNTPLTQAKARCFLWWMQKWGRLLSLFQMDPSQYLVQLDNRLLAQLNLDRSQIDKMIELRNEARKGKDFKKSDEIRDQLLALGISIKDSPLGTTWEVTK